MPQHETGIQWTHVPGYTGATWNPTTGCTRVSPGCDHCYAFTLHDQRYAVNLRAAVDQINATKLSPVPERGVEKVAAVRSAGLPLPMARQYDVPFSTVQVLGDERLTEPLHRKSPRAYFVDSMSDLFHEAVPDEVIDRVFAVMALSPQHLFMVLTKRPERMRAYLTATEIDVGTAWKAWRQDKVLWAAQTLAEESKREVPWSDTFPAWPLPNVWLGVTVEDQARADERIPLLLDTPAAVRFLSCEPLLGPIEFSNVSGRADAVRQLGRPALAGIDWVIVGGESGKGARPFDLAWARSLRDQCAAVGVPFFMKQMGSHPHDRNDQGFEGEDESEWPAGTLVIEQSFTPVQGDSVLVRLRHPHGGNLEEWPEDLRVRQWPGVAGAEVGS